ncbi:hypothetical protein KZP23_14080 [Echinicola marina]|uniref:hypothetical protein n=1 Tax=Echinicola marina TaxID=2859768 RepID=UPI001CF70D68|nr:hypothetical protein [Echinicola marina]UCS91857.1 hypothetical protein KZP23_14080 [Echinicola marina]
MKRILGLDLGTNSIGWALVEKDFQEKCGKLKMEDREGNGGEKQEIPRSTRD